MVGGGWGDAQKHSSYWPVRDCGLCATHWSPRQGDDFSTNLHRTSDFNVCHSISMYVTRHFSHTHRLKFRIQLYSKKEVQKTNSTKNTNGSNVVLCSPPKDPSQGELPKTRKELPLDRAFPPQQTREKAFRDMIQPRQRSRCCHCSEEGGKANSGAEKLALSRRQLSGREWRLLQAASDPVHPVPTKHLGPVTFLKSQRRPTASKVNRGNPSPPHQQNPQLFL